MRASSQNGRGLDRIFFANSGTEAIDGALKLARLCGRPAPGALSKTAAKTRILAMQNSFHGRTFGALSITASEKYRAPFEPLVPRVEFVTFNDIADLEAKFDDRVCAIVLETIQGEGGIYPVTEAFWERARALATQHGALLIADEIQCGLGRTGRYFAYQQFFFEAGYRRHSQTTGRWPPAWRDFDLHPSQRESRQDCMAPLSAAAQ